MRTPTLWLRDPGILEAEAVTGTNYPLFEDDAQLDNLKRDPRFIAFMAQQKQLRRILNCCSRAITLVENWPMWSMSVRRFIANYANFLVGEDTEIALFERCDRLQVGPPVGYFG